MSNVEPTSKPQTEKEWRLIEKLVMSLQAEQKRDRRWRIFFRLLGFGYLLMMLVLFYPTRMGGATDAGVTSEHTALVDVKGIIADDAEANADSLSTALRKAFEAEHSKAVLLRINSPGGSPVQSNYVYREITRLKDKHPEKKVYAVITDMGASGAYYIAAAADEIYVDPSSIVGSIGVIMAGFGFTEAIEKMGIERRVLTSGDNKALMDPFAPMKDEQKEHFQAMLDTVHDEFIQAVKEGRGERLQSEEHPELFSGLVWSGSKAVELGLADGFGSPGSVARDVIDAEKIVDYTVVPNPFERWFQGFGVSVGKGVGQTLGLNTELR